jgi:hypothetical protein
MTEYWSQWSSKELLSDHGVDDADEDCVELDLDDLRDYDYVHECPRCHNGCNYCLMT